MAITLSRIQNNRLKPKSNRFKRLDHLISCINTTKPVETKDNCLTLPSVSSKFRKENYLFAPGTLRSKIVNQELREFMPSLYPKNNESKVSLLRSLEKNQINVVPSKFSSNFFLPSVNMDSKSGGRQSRMITEPSISAHPSQKQITVQFGPRLGNRSTHLISKLGSYREPREHPNQNKIRMRPNPEFSIQTLAGPRSNSISKSSQFIKREEISEKKYIFHR